MICHAGAYRRVVSHIGALAFLIVVQSCGGGSSPSSQGSGSAPNPAVTSISPTTIQAGAGDTTITVSGSNFVVSSVITFNGQSLATTYKSSTLLAAVIPAADLTSGSAIQIGVSNSATSASNTVLFQIDDPAPLLNSITPSSVTLGTSGTLTLTGTGFVPTSTVLFNGTSRTPTYVSSTSLQLTLSASDVAAAINDTVAVVNAAPGGGTSPSVSFYVTQITPSLASVSPTSIESGAGNVTLSLSGSNFSSTATVQANGSNISIISQNATTITATLPAPLVSQAGTVTVVVTNSGTNAESSAPVPIQIVDIPTLCCINPAAAPIGSPDLTITIQSPSFLVPGTIVQWNGQPLVTQNDGGFQLTATIPALDLASFSGGSLTLAVPVAYPPTTLVSAPQPFSTYLALANDAILYNPHDNLLYASVPGSIVSTEANSIVGIDPVTGNVMRTIPVGSQPNQIAISDDGTQMFVGLDGAGAVRQVNLTTGQAGAQFSLGGGPGVYNPPFTAAALAVLPGEPNSVAVFSTSGIVTIYDSGVPRPKNSSGLINTYFDQNFGALAFGLTASTLYVSAGPFQGVVKLTVDATGITGGTDFPVSSGASGVSIQYDNSRLFLASGIVLDANTGTQLGTFSASTSGAANGPIVSESTLNLAFIGYSPIPNASSEVLAFNETTFNPSGTINVPGANGTAQGIARWGQNGLALATGNQIYVLQSSVVKDLSSSPADVSVTLGGPASSGTGAVITYTATIKNQGPNQAQGIAFVSTLSDSLIVNSATPSSGTCGAGGEVVCNLGDLASGSSATVKFNIT